MKDPKIERILVPIDFSEITEAVIEHGCFLSRTFGAEMMVLHVVQVPPLAEASTWLDPVISPSVEQDIRMQMMKGSEEQMSKIKTECEEQCHKPEIIVKEGVPFDEIVKVAQDRDIDLIVMGTHGRTGLRHIIIGSVAERVLRRAPCSVFCINPKAIENESEK